VNRQLIGTLTYAGLIAREPVPTQRVPAAVAKSTDYQAFRHAVQQSFSIGSPIHSALIVLVNVAAKRPIKQGKIYIDGSRRLCEQVLVVWVTACVKPSKSSTTKLTRSLQVHQDLL
jgi:hypothetical protein